MNLFSEILMLEPIGIYRVLERHNTGLVVENVFLDKDAPGTCHRRRRGYVIFIHHLRRTDRGFACDQRPQIIELLGRQRFGYGNEQQAQLFDQRRVGFPHDCFGTVLGGSQPCKLRQLLHIIGMIVGKSYKQGAGRIIDYFPCFRESTFDEIDPIRSFDLVQENNISELIKRLRRIGKYFEHHVPLAAIQTIGDMLVLLPMRAETFLKKVGIVEFCNILKFVDADHDFQTFLLRYIFCKVENLVWIAFYLLPVEIERHFVCRIIPDNHLGHDSGEEFFCIPDCFVPTRRGRFDNVLRQQRIKMGLIAHIEEIDVADAEVLVLSGRCLLYTYQSPRDRTRSRIQSYA